MFKHAHAYDAVSGGVAVAEGAHGRSDANTLDGNPGHGPAGRCAVELLQEPQTVIAGVACQRPGGRDDGQHVGVNVGDRSGKHIDRVAR